MIIPMIVAAAADKSLIFFIISCFSYDMKSEIASIAVLIRSIVNIPPMQIVTTIHSVADMFSIISAITTIMATVICIHALCSLTTRSFNPLKAYLKLPILLFTENFPLFIFSPQKRLFCQIFEYDIRTTHCCQINRAVFISCR